MEIALAVVAAASCLLALVIRIRADRAIAAAERARAEAALLLRRLRIAHRALGRQVAVLQAIRDMTLAANDDEAIEPILAALGRILERLLGARAVGIHLLEGGNLVPRHARRQGRTYLDADPCPRAAELARLALSEQAIVRGVRPVASVTPAAASTVTPAGAAPREVGGDAGTGPDDAAAATGPPSHPATSSPANPPSAPAAAPASPTADLAALAPLLATPLPACREQIGVVVCELDPRLDERGLREAERTLQAIAKHAALAIVKPTLYDRATIDELTGLLTKRHFTHELGRLLAQSRRTGDALALILCDVDHFKRVNDSHGHLSGDLVLAEVGAALRAGIRRYDAAFRYGGEEMAILAPKADLGRALRLAERLRSHIAAIEVTAPDGRPLRVTASFGVAAFGPSRESPEALILAADRALYRAKAEGRDRVAACDPVRPSRPAPARRRPSTPDDPARA